MSFTIVDAPQRSAEWYQARAGRLTGSVAADILSSGRAKGTESVGRRDLRTRLALEQLTGLAATDDDGYVSRDMQRGIDKEAAALLAYEAVTGLIVRRTGFLADDDLMTGCSLDGDVRGFAGIVEVKCPKRATHLHALRARQLPPEYEPQVLHNLWQSGAAWCDFVSFDDRFPRATQLVVVHVARTDLDVPAYALAARLFLNQVEAERLEIAGLGAPRCDCRPDERCEVCHPGAYSAPLCLVVGSGVTQDGSTPERMR